MATVEWKIEGKEFGNCNCAYGCPCQFNALPTHGDCRAVNSFEIEKGHFGDVKLDGLRAVCLYEWPGPVHEGKGTMQVIIDKRADARQRNALLQILMGKETDDMATMWWVYSAMSPNKLEPMFETVDLDVDVDARRARVVVAGVVESVGVPIKNPVTGLDHRVRIDMPAGFEYRLAEIGSGRTTASGQIKLDLKDTYGQFARLHLSNKGIVDAARP
ncbi:MAG: DUF1326 domain-containing protein [Burkholderiaceae bacterium]